LNPKIDEYYSELNYSDGGQSPPCYDEGGEMHDTHYEYQLPYEQPQGTNLAQAMWQGTQRMG